MADYPFWIPDSRLQDQLEHAVDQEGKIPRALEMLGPMAGKSVVLLDGDRGVRAAQLETLGARVTAVPGLSMSGLPRGMADAVVSLWAGFQGGSADTTAQIREVELVLRPGGRLLVVHDYGRDDVGRMLDDARERDHVAWSRRDGWFLLHEFKVRVLHCWWTFESLEHAEAVLVEAFGPSGSRVSGALRRPRLEYKVAVYHRTLGAGP